jgi:uncharacterized protein (DUF58 family)
MAISGVLGKRNIEGCILNVELPAEIYDGRPTLAALRLENAKRLLPSFLVTVNVFDQRILFPLVPRHGEARRQVTVSFRGRGRKNFTSAQIASIFPINFFVRRRRLAFSGQCLVFPAPVPCAGAEGEAPRRARGEAATRQAGYEGDLRRITTYRGGEPLKLIHWKLSARHDELKVKEFSAGGGEPVTIDPALLPGADLEARLRCASFLVESYLRRERPVGLRLGGRRIAPATGRSQKRKLLTELALHGLD